ncbi:glycosyltransferase [Desertivirga xinjiangensis]|uniref:glycosyltransferase n=1 Tax=Desertivirga xinjiangensis TaxID=539206 RepID=UPI00210CB793|nr:glycosyltransferase [Pedobacter xinjiangensis]
MAKITYNICALIVTYGDRWEFLKQVVLRVLSFAEISDVLIVDNASVYDVSRNCLSLDDQRIKVLVQGKNTGSAGGYKAGLKHFEQYTTADLVWLLDDDNLPDTQALDHLIASWTDTLENDDSKALFCLRQDRKQHVSIASGEDPYRYYLVPDSFLGFSLFRIPYNQYLKFKDRFKKEGLPTKKVTLPYAPYGGMFLHRNLLRRIGYPDERFFLYADDSEYTFRITQNGGKIWLIPSSQIIDIDRSYGVTYKSRIWRSVFLDLWSFRTYYQVRNSVFFNKVAIRSPALFQVNMYLCLAMQWAISVITSKEKEYRCFLKAVNDGLSGNLGNKDTQTCQVNDSSTI